MFPEYQNGNQAQVQHHNWIIQPDNIIYRRWQQILILPLFYFCFISSMLGTFSAPPSPLYIKIANGVVSVFFAVDLGLSFFVAYWDKIAFVMVNDRRRIASKTAKSVFLHVVLIVPFEVVATLFNPFHPSSRIGYHIWSMLALLRIFSSIKIHRWFSELEENENINYIVVRIAKMIWVCCLVCHYGGCVFYIMAASHNDVKNTWFSLVGPNFTEQGLIKRYVTSIYYAVISFTTVGYGDLHPVSIDEKVFSVIFLLVDFGLVAYVTTTIVLLVAPDVGPLGKYRARRVRVLDFCRRYRLSDELCNEVSSRLKLEYLSQLQPSEENGILESLPTTVKRKILIALSNAVTNNSMFNHLSNPIRFQLIQAMEPVSFPANTSVILEHEVPTFLYFIARGSVDLIFPEDIIETVGPGNVFGETCVFFNTPQVFTATTREQSHFLMLDRVNLISILHGCPNDTSHMIGDYIDQVLSVSTNSHMTKLLEDFEDNAERVGRIDLPVSLMFAFERGYSRLFDRLVEEYPDLNESDSTGRTVLHRAASHGDVWKVNKLLGIGANPNSKDLSGNVPLWNAMLGGHANAVQVLETNGGTLEGCPVGHYACIAASLDNMDALQALSHRDNQFLSVPNDHGRTALHVAMVRDNFPMVQYLVESGVPMDEDDNYGDSAYVLATRHGGDQIVNYLELMLLPQLI